MTDGETPSQESVPLSMARRIDQVCEQLEAGWRHGHPPRLEDLLGDTSEPERSERLRRLLELELELRKGKGERPRAEEYLARFPNHGSLILLLVHDADTTVDRGARNRALSLSTRRPLPVVPGYEVLQELGSGGMGIVYKARQFGLDRVVALKMLRAGDLATESEQTRFREEARAVAQLRHPNIIQVHEVGEHEGRVYFTQEYAEGGSLADWLDGTPLPPYEAAKVVRLLALAMAAAHAQGVLHRDLKPANVLLARGRDPSVTSSGMPVQGSPLNTFLVKVADFGLARWLGGESELTPTGAIVGTPSYMAPEQAAGGQVGPSADVYSLGAILYDLLTGRPPFRGQTPLQTLEQVQQQDPVPPAQLQQCCPQDLNNITLKCLEKEPQRRYESAQELADDLGRFLEGRPVRARPLGWPGRAARWTRRNPLAATLLVVVAVVFVAGFAGTLWQLEVARAHLVRANRQQERFEQAFRKARDAVDTFTAVSLRELADRPYTRAARRKLLETALDYYRDLVTERGDDTSLRADLALTQLRLADLTASLGDRQKAVVQYRSALEVQRQVVAEDPSDSRQRRHLAGTCTNLGNLLRWLGPEPLKEATGYYQEALNLWEQEVRGFPEDSGAQRELGRALLNLGTAHTEARRWDDARRCFESARQRLENWSARAPKDVSLGLTRARADRLLGDVLEETGHRQEALRVQKEGVALCEAIHREHPQDAATMRELAFAHNDLGILYKRAQQLAAARTSYERARDLYRGLLRLDPEDVELAEGISGSLYNLGILCANLGDLSASATALEEAVVTHRKLLAANPNDGRMRSRLNVRLRDLGKVRRLQGQVEQAESLALERQKLWPEDREQLFLSACELALCIPLVKMEDRTSRKRLTGLAVEALGRAVKLGFQDVARLRGAKELTPLRGEAEFEKLLRELGR